MNLGYPLSPIVLQGHVLVVGAVLNISLEFVQLCISFRLINITWLAFREL